MTGIKKHKPRHRNSAPETAILEKKQAKKWKRFAWNKSRGGNSSKRGENLEFYPRRRSSDTIVAILGSK